VQTDVCPQYRYARAFVSRDNLRSLVRDSTTKQSTLDVFD